MFVLHTSNKTENLLQHLLKILERPLSSPLVKEQFLIQSQGMQRWLSQQLAEKRGVWANFAFHYPGKFFGGIVDALHQGEPNELYSQEQLIWHFDGVLRDLKGDQFRVLLQYLQGENADLKRYQLSQQLAYLFDQYQFMRPDWLMAWEQNRLCLNNDAEIWQADLWRELQQRHGRQSKGHLWLSVIREFVQLDPENARAILPERLLVFGINAMSPVYLHFLQAISQFTDVHFFLLNPSREYWADAPNAKALARRIADMPGADQLPLQGVNPLLASSGQQGRDFQKLLLADMEFQLEYNSFEPAAEQQTVLGRLQDDILNNRISAAPMQADGSIAFHSCHSRMRETQVMRDQLLHCFDEDESLGLRDVVVMMPDIQMYAPYITAVFADIPHAVADRTVLDSNDALSVFLRFLSLSQGRWELEAVLDVLEQEVVFRKFTLTEPDLEIIRGWLGHTAVRWGESAAHREELGFVPFAGNSWQAALERMLMGYANANDEQFINEVLPFADIEGSQAQTLGCLHDFLSVLGAAKKTFAAAHTLQYWRKHLSELAGSLLINEGDYQAQFSQLMTVIEQLGEHGDIHQHRLPLDVVLHWMQSAAAAQQSVSGFLRGQLTFCSMLPMRAIPFRVIGLMGLNEGEYPHVDNRTAFDLMAKDFRLGDKSPRHDERYQFLEVLLSCREKLLITYTGQSLKTNEALPPSILVSETLELLQQHYQLEQPSLVTEHPLHAYSQRYFNSRSGLFSYSAQQYAVASAMANPEPGGFSSWWQGEIEPKRQSSIVELADLLDFYAHPQRHFLLNQLDLRVPVIERSEDETEPFALDSLAGYTIMQQWIQRHLQGDDDDGFFYRQLMAQGRWVNGAAGRLLFEEYREEAQQFADRVLQYRQGELLEPMPVNLEIGGYVISGRLGPRFADSNLLYRYANLKGKDVVQSWLIHLILQSQSATPTWLIARDQSWYLPSCENSYEAHLENLLAHYAQGQQSPSPLIIEPAFAWQEHYHGSSRSKRTPLEVATDSLKRLLEYDDYLRLLYQYDNADGIIGEAFEHDCRSLLSPVWSSRDVL